MKNFLFLLMFFSSGIASAQSGDFLLLKKKRKTIKSYYSGTKIELVTKAGIYKNGLINKIENDSLFLQEFLLEKHYLFGFPVIDTVGSFHYTCLVKDIQSIIKKTKANFDWSASGAGLLGGGILITAASGVVYLADRDKFSPQLLVAGASLGIIGYFLSKSKPRSIIIGKRGYLLEYVKMK